MCFGTAQYDRVALAQALLAAAGCNIDGSGPVDRDDDVVVAVGEIASLREIFAGDDDASMSCSPGSASEAIRASNAVSRAGSRSTRSMTCP